MPAKPTSYEPGLSLTELGQILADWWMKGGVSGSLGMPEWWQDPMGTAAGFAGGGVTRIFKPHLREVGTRFETPRGSGYYTGLAGHGGYPRNPAANDGDYLGAIDDLADMFVRNLVPDTPPKPANANVGLDDGLPKGWRREFGGPEPVRGLRDEGRFVTDDEGLHFIVEWLKNFANEP